jgi:hypothetical protein
MRDRIALLLIVLSVSVYACAQEGTVEHGWTDKNNTEMYAAYMLQNAVDGERNQLLSRNGFRLRSIALNGRFRRCHLGDLAEEPAACQSRCQQYRSSRCPALCRRGSDAQFPCIAGRSRKHPQEADNRPRHD